MFHLELMTKKSFVKIDVLEILLRRVRCRLLQLVRTNRSSYPCLEGPDLRSK